LSDSQELSDDFEREKPSQLDENGSPQSDKNDPPKQAVNSSQQGLEETKSNASRKGTALPPIDSRASKLQNKEPETIKTPTSQQPTPVEGRNSKIPPSFQQINEPKQQLSSTINTQNAPVDNRASKAFSQTQPIQPTPLEILASNNNNILADSPDPEKSLGIDVNPSPKNEFLGTLPSETHTSPISFVSPKMKGRLSPKYAHNLTHGKSMMVRSFGNYHDNIV